MLDKLNQPKGSTIGVLKDGRTVQETFDALGIDASNLKKAILTTGMFGAKGDGSNDDSASLQAAINAAVATGLPLRFLPGTYKVNTTLVAKSTVNLLGAGHTYYTGTTKVVCGTAGMTLFKFEGAENSVRNMVIRDYLDIIDDPTNGYGQGGTCRGFEFLRSNGSKDLDSKVIDCHFAGFRTGLEATGAALKVQGCMFTAIRLPMVFRAAAGAPDDFRGFILRDNRFHKCGGNGYTNDAVCITTVGKFKNSSITDSFADAGLRSFYHGMLAEGAEIRGLVVRYGTGDLITVDNSGLTPSSAYQHYSISDVSYETPTGSPPVAGGTTVVLVNAPGGRVANISQTFTRLGALRAESSNDLMITGLNIRNMGVNYLADPNVDALSFVNCSNVIVGDVIVRNTLDAAQTRSIISVDAGSRGVFARDIGWVNVKAFSTGSGTVLGERRNVFTPHPVMTQLSPDGSPVGLLTPSEGGVYNCSGDTSIVVNAIATELPLGSEFFIRIASAARGGVTLQGGGAGIGTGSNTLVYKGNDGWNGCMVRLVLTSQGWVPTSKP